MEDQNQPLDAGMDSGATDQRLLITDPVRSDWNEIAKWAMFFAVLLFIVLGFVAIASLAMIFTAGVGGFVMAIFIVGIYGSVLYFPASYFYKFSTQTRQALNFDDSNALDEGFTNLKRYYRFVGILFIVVMALYALFILIALATRGFSGLMPPGVD